MRKRLQSPIDAPREVSVASLYRPAEGIGGDGERVPYLRLSGRWLEELGFVKGPRVVVSEEGQLTLTVADCRRSVIARSSDR